MNFIINHRLSILSIIDKGGVGVEIGVHEGNFSRTILNRCNPKLLYLVDPWVCFDDEQYSKSLYGALVDQNIMDQRYNAVNEKFKNEIQNKKIKILREFSYKAANSIPDNSLDFVYIDGDHTYEGVMKDLESYYPKLKKNGLIIGDDYQLNGWWKDGVVRAFNEFLSKREFFIEVKIENQIAVRKL